MPRTKEIRIVNFLKKVKLTSDESTTLGTINGSLFKTNLVFYITPLQIILESEAGFDNSVELYGKKYFICSKCKSIHSIDLLKLASIHSMLTRKDDTNYDILKAARAYINFQNKELLEDFLKNNLPEKFLTAIKNFITYNFFPTISVSKSLDGSVLESMPPKARLVLSEFITYNDITIPHDKTILGELEDTDSSFN